MKFTNNRHRIDTIFVLIIFCVFAVSVLMVLILGAGTYERVTALSRDGYTDRSILSYIWTKVKNSDSADCICVGEFNGLSALYIEEEFGQIKYRTTIYQYNGWVCELFYEKGLDFEPEDGARIIQFDDLSFKKLENGLIKVSSGDNELLIFPRGKASGTAPHADIAEGGPFG